MSSRPESIKVRFLDLSVKDPELKGQLLDAVDRVLTHGRIVLGPEVDEFELRVAEHCQKKTLTFDMMICRKTPLR